MAQDFPPWLSKDFLKAALQGAENPSPSHHVTIIEFSVSRAVPPGTNYISLPFRVNVDYKVGENREKISLIIKTPVTTGTVGELVTIGDHYCKELKVYNRVLPVLNNLLKCNFGPKHFHTYVDKVLVLQDMNDQGYVMCDRYKQLDLLHCQHVLKTLAKFHAASVACTRQHMGIIEEVSHESLYFENILYDKQMKPWIEESLRQVGKIVREMGLGTSAEDLFQSRVDDAAELVVKLCKPKENGLNVLNHGDMWVNNILFKHTASGSIVDVKLIDFQLTRYTSPVMDLIYFIWTSANEDVRESKLPELCEMYRQTLNTTLEQLGCEERLSEEAFRQDFREAVYWAVIIVCKALPITTSDFKSGINHCVANGSVIDVFGGKELLFGGKYFKALLPKLVEHLQSWISYYK